MSEDGIVFRSFEWMSYKTACEMFDFSECMFELGAFGRVVLCSSNLLDFLSNGFVDWIGMVMSIVGFEFQISKLFFQVRPYFAFHYGSVKIISLFDGFVR